MKLTTLTLARADTGAVLPFAKIRVFKSDGVTAASIYDAGGSPLTQPLTADSNGSFSFAAANDTYILRGTSADGGYTVPDITYDAFDLKAVANALATATVAGMVAKVKSTKSLLLADLAAADGAMGLVYADTTATDNDLYVKSGASGSGSWTASGLFSGVAAAYAAAARAAASGALKYKGVIDCSTNPNYPAATAGDFYVVSVAGKIGGGSGLTVSIGNFLFNRVDAASGTQAGVGASWDVVQTSLSGALIAASNLSDVANAATARSNLGLAIGSNVQAWDADLDALAALGGTNTIYYRSGAGTWSPITIAGGLGFSGGTLTGALLAPLASPPLTGTPTAPTAGSSTNNTQIATTGFVQTLIANLINSAPSPLNTLGGIAAQMASDESAVTALTTTVAGKLAKASNLSDLTDASAARTNLGLAIGTNVQAYDADLAAIASLATTSYGRSILTVADAGALRTLAGLAIGTDVQAYNSGLAAISALATTTFGRSLLTTTDPASARTALGTPATGSIKDSGLTIRANRLAGRIATLAVSADANDIADAATYFSSSDHASYTTEASLTSNGAGLRDGNLTGTAPSTAHCTDLAAGQYLRIDLGASAPIVQVKVATNQTFGPSLLNGAVLSGSVDGTSYTTIATIAGAANGAYTTIPVGATYRYLRLMGPSGGLAVSEFFAVMDTRGAVQELALSSLFTLTGSTIGINAVNASAGSGDAGKVPLLNVSGEFDPTVMGSDGYIKNKRLLLCPEGAITYPGDFVETIENSALTIHSTSDLYCGHSTVKWGNDSKSSLEFFAKSRGATISAFAPLVLGDRVCRTFIQGAGTGGQFGHMGTLTWLCDKTPTNAGEVGGRYEINTDTGLHSSEADPARPNYYALKSAFSLNSRQQCFLPGKLTPLPAAGSDFGGLLVLGIGGGLAGEGQIKFTLSGTTLLATPESGAFEADSSGVFYLTNGSGTRGGVLTGDGNLAGLASASAARGNLSVYSTSEVDSAIAAAVTGLLEFKGSTDCSGNPNYPAASKGDAYVVSVAGKIGGASGTSVDVGDVYVASTDNAGGTQASVGTSWFLLEHNLAGALLAANNLSDIANAATARNNLGLAAVAASGSASDLSTGTLPAGRLPALTGDITSSAGSAATTLADKSVTLAKQADMATASVVYRKTAGSGSPEVQTLATLKADLGLTGTNSGDQTISLTGDVAGSGTGSFATTLATVNSNVGSFGSATQVATFTVNAKGLTTAAGNVTITPAVGSITGLGTGIATALAVNTGSAGAPVLFNGAGGTPASLTATNVTGLPLTTGVTGILPLANGGTGVAPAAHESVIYGQTQSSGDSAAVNVLAAAGTGASATVVWLDGMAVVTLTTGTGPTTGDLFDLVYPHAFPTRSAPMWCANNASAGNAFGKNGYVYGVASKATFAVGGTAPAASTVYVVTIRFQGN